MTVKNVYVSTSKTERDELQKHIHQKCILILQTSKAGG